MAYNARYALNQHRRRQWWEDMSTLPAPDGIGEDIPSLRPVGATLDKPSIPDVGANGAGEAAKGGFPWMTAARVGLGLGSAAMNAYGSWRQAEDMEKLGNELKEKRGRGAPGAAQALSEGTGQIAGHTKLALQRSSRDTDRTGGIGQTLVRTRALTDAGNARAGLQGKVFAADANYRDKIQDQINQVELAEAAARKGVWSSLAGGLPYVGGVLKDYADSKIEQQRYEEAQGYRQRAEAREQERLKLSKRRVANQEEQQKTEDERALLAIEAQRLNNAAQAAIDTQQMEMDTQTELLNKTGSQIRTGLVRRTEDLNKDANAAELREQKRALIGRQEEANAQRAEEAAAAEANQPQPLPPVTQENVGHFYTRARQVLPNTTVEDKTQAEVAKVLKGKLGNEAYAGLMEEVYPGFVDLNRDIVEWRSHTDDSGRPMSDPDQVPTGLLDMLANFNKRMMARLGTDGGVPAADMLTDDALQAYKDLTAEIARVYDTSGKTSIKDKVSGLNARSL